jgi:DTW domain.
VAHRTEVLILQHPLEVHEAKGTARLLHLSLPHSRMVTGERFDAARCSPC